MTHAHEDHCGLARSLRDEAKDAEVLVHGWETGHRLGRLEYDEHRQLLVRAGVPPRTTSRRFGACTRDVRAYADALEDHEHGELRLRMEWSSRPALCGRPHPGHRQAPARFCARPKGRFWRANCVLKRITPNPILSPDPIARRAASLAVRNHMVSSRASARSRRRSSTAGTASRDGFGELCQRYMRAPCGASIGVIRLVPKTGATAGTWRARFPGADDVPRFLAAPSGRPPRLAHSEASSPSKGRRARGLPLKLVVR